MAKYIDADMAIEKLSCINPTEPTIWYSDAVEAINNTPAADVVERKKGKWINHRNDMGHNIADCSGCGEAMQWYDPDTRPNYCPNCGADMRGKSNEAD